MHATEQWMSCVTFGPIALLQARGLGFRGCANSVCTCVLGSACVGIWARHATYRHELYFELSIPLENPYSHPL